MTHYHTVLVKSNTHPAKVRSKLILSCALLQR